MLSYGNRNLSGVCRNVICMAMKQMQILCQEQGLISMIWSYCVGTRTGIAQRILLSLLSETIFFCNFRTGSGGPNQPPGLSLPRASSRWQSSQDVHLNTLHFPLAIAQYLIKHRDTSTCTFQRVFYIPIYGLFKDTVSSSDKDTLNNE